jgi:hypothetical protein
MTETIEQAAEKYSHKKGDIPTTELEDAIFKQGFKDGATWQLSQPSPHRIYITQVIELEDLYNSGKITRSRMVEILNEIAAGKHKERIEL